MYRYEEYKETGFEWIGQIPKHWEVKKISLVSDITTGNTPPTGNENFYRNGNVLWVKPGDLNEFIPITRTEQQLSPEGGSVSRPLKEKSILICGIGTIGKFGFSERIVTTNQQIHGVTFRPDDVDPDFGIFLLGSMSNEFERLSEKVVVPILNKGNMARVRIPIPSIAEQKLISRYLDKKAKQIDSLIEKIQKKIELLKEKQTSLINQCVTKGLDPNVEMKDSGVEWIGEIPKHWEIKRLKHNFNIEAGRDPSSVYSDDGEYEVLGTGGVIGSTHAFMCDQTSLILGRKGTIDKPFVQKTPFWLSDVAYYAIPKSYISPFYQWFLFSQIDFTFYKYGSTLPSMSKNEYGNMKFPVPPKNEIVAVEICLKKTQKKFSRLIGLLTKKMSTLREYRQSLISSAVTGKVRVTEDML